MGVYLRGRYYWYKRMIDGVCYYKSLKVKKGQETMLSAREILSNVVYGPELSISR
jgi:hypothetical protein